MVREQKKGRSQGRSSAYAAKREKEIEAEKKKVKDHSNVSRLSKKSASGGGGSIAVILWGEREPVIKKR